MIGVFFILLGVLLVVVVPIVALVWSSAARAEARRLRAEVELLRVEVRGRPAATAEPPPTPAETAPVAPEPPAPVASPPPGVPPILAEPGAPPPRVPPLPARRIDWEQFMGVKLVAWVGGLALFLALAFLIKYSFEHDLVPPAVRVSLAYAAGLALVAGGIHLFQRGYAVTGQTLGAAGVVTLYAITFACHAVYRFPVFGPAVAFTLMVVITAGAFLLATWQRAQVIAVLGLIGGCLTPVLLATGRDPAVALFAYVALLDAGVLAILWRRRWSHLALLAALGTAGLCVWWFGNHFETWKLPVTVLAGAGFVALFGAGHWLLGPRGPGGAWFAAATVVATVVAAGAALSLALVPATAARPAWVFALLLAADLGALLAFARHGPWRDAHPVAGLAALAIVGVWLEGQAETAAPGWLLGLPVAFGALHAAVPLAFARLRPPSPDRGWAAFFPLLGLAALAVPLLAGAAAGLGLWVGVLLLDAVALAVAAFTASLMPLALVLLGTVILLTLAIARLAPEVDGVPAEFALVLAAAALFTGAATLLGRRFAARGIAAPRWTASLPDVSLAFPFLLLVLLAARRETLPLPLLFGATALLAAALLGLAAARRSGAPAVVALAGIVIAAYSVHALRFFAPGGTGPWGWTAGFGLALAAFPFLAPRRLLPLQGVVAASALGGVLLLPLLAHQVRAAWPGAPLGLVALAGALPPALALAGVARLVAGDTPWRANRLAWFGGATLFFLTAAVPLQWSRHAWTIGWALEGAALFWLFRRVPHPGLRTVGGALLAAVFVRLALNPEVLHYRARGAAPLLNWILATYGTGAAAFFAAAAALRPGESHARALAPRAVLAAGGTVIAFLLVNLQVADYFTAPGEPLALSFSGNFARDMAYTVAWSLFALLLLVAGIRWRARGARYAALALLGLAVAKLFLHDLARLAQLYRVGALAAFAMAAIVASLLYHRFLARGRPPGDSPAP